jgi:hypothetical protein
MSMGPSTRQLVSTVLNTDVDASTARDTASRRPTDDVSDLDAGLSTNLATTATALHKKRSRVDTTCMAEILPEIFALVLEHLDCEGIRKISCVNSALRLGSLRSLALAVFTSKSVTLMGEAHTFNHNTKFDPVSRERVTIVLWSDNRKKNSLGYM